MVLGARQPKQAQSPLKQAVSWAGLQMVLLPLDGHLRQFGPRPKSRFSQREQPTRAAPAS